MQKKSRLFFSLPSALYLRQSQSYGKKRKRQVFSGQNPKNNLKRDKE
jgi:hypothetical protein